jgi:gas vesicle protein
MDDEARFLVIGGLAFATGLLVGVGTGLLLAPQSGARTRRQLGNLAEDVREEAVATAHDTKEVVSDAIDGVIERGKRFVK